MLCLELVYGRSLKLSLRGRRVSKMAPWDTADPDRNVSSSERVDVCDDTRDISRSRAEFRKRRSMGVRWTPRARDIMFGRSDLISRGKIVHQSDKREVACGPSRNVRKNVFPCMRVIKIMRRLERVEKREFEAHPERCANRTTRLDPMRPFSPSHIHTHTHVNHTVCVC